MVDADHFAVRFLVPVLGLVIAVIFHILVSALLGDWLEDNGTTPGCVIVPADVLVFVGAASLTERALKRWMPARRSATLSHDSLTFHDGRGKTPQTVRFALRQTLNAHAWRFEVKRRTRVPKGWYCLALYVLQDEQDAIFYTFMDGKEAETMPAYAHFIRLRPRRETQNSTDLASMAQQRRLLELEDRRWNDGAEVGPDDFRAMLAAIAQADTNWI